MTPKSTDTTAARKRQEARLRPALEKRLLAYAAAASAAGVGALALAQPAEAKIVYTPAHVVLTSIPLTSYKLDLNHDGINDFSLYAGYDFFQSGNRAFVGCGPLVVSNTVWGRDFRSALQQGTKIGRLGTFDRRFWEMGSVTYFTTAREAGFHGPWVNSGKGVKDRYLGLKFVINGKVHYGWARLNVKVRSQYIVNITTTLAGYAYETEPNKAIIAGKTKGRGVIAEPTTLGHLARGAAAPSER